MRQRAHAEPPHDPTVGRPRRTRRQQAATPAGAASRATPTHAAAVALGALGGQARAKNLSAKRLTQIGRLGAATRWSKKKKGSR